MIHASPTESKPSALFILKNVSIKQQDYSYLYSNDKIALKEMIKKTEWLIFLKKKIRKLLLKKAKIDGELKYWEYKILDSEVY